MYWILFIIFTFKNNTNMTKRKENRLLLLIHTLGTSTPAPDWISNFINSLPCCCWRAARWSAVFFEDFSTLLVWDSGSCCNSSWVIDKLPASMAENSGILPAWNEPKHIRKMYVLCDTRIFSLEGDKISYWVFRIKFKIAHVVTHIIDQ